MSSESATIPAHVWFAARTRNATRRPLFIAAVGIAALIGVLMALVVPRQRAARSGQNSLRPPVQGETAAFIAAARQARDRRDTADSAIQAARRLSAGRLPTVDSLSASVVARRDSIGEAISELDALL